MNQPVPLSQWLSAARPSDLPVAWLADHLWTLAQLRYDVSQAIKRLQQQPDDRWALCFTDSYLFVVGLLAVLHAGKTPVVPGHSRKSLLEEQKTLFDGVLCDQHPGCHGTVLVIHSARCEAQIVDTFTPINDQCHIELFTSGSTGVPRRVIKPVSCLDQEVGLLAAHFAGQLENCRIIASVAPQHLYGLTFRVFLPMSLGIAFHASMLYYAEQLTTLSRNYRYLFVSSPAFLKRLDDRLSVPPVDVVLSAGGTLDWQYVSQATGWLGCKLEEIYGSTETGVLAWRWRHQDDVVWQPFPGVNILSEGEGFRVTSALIPDEKGLLLDDVLQFDASGCFRLFGRRGRIVKIEEKRVSLCEIEQRLLELDGIQDAAVLPLMRGGRLRIAALVVLDTTTRQQWQTTSSKALEQSWRYALSSWLESVVIPRYWRVIDEIPVNSMNKRVYTQLQELFHESQ